MNMAIPAPENYGSVWQRLGLEEYQGWHRDRIGYHKDFMAWMKDKEIETVLEVGCGYGLYPIEHKELFDGMVYTGIDLSLAGINHCNTNTDCRYFRFIYGDFINLTWGQQYDLIFAHAVIDHVYDPNTFAQLIARATKKYGFIGLYHGYHPGLENHKMEWIKALDCYNTQISAPELSRALEGVLKPGEFTIGPFSGTDGAVLIEKERT